MAEDGSTWSLYMIRCGDNSLYTGITTDVVQRFLTHASGSSRGAKYLRARHPLKLIYALEVGDRSRASQLEYKIKKLPKLKKEQLVSGGLSLREVEG